MKYARQMVGDETKFVAVEGCHANFVVMPASEYDELVKKADEESKLNNNLLRIMTERANADRELRPKKQHSGFVVLTSSERETQYADHYKNKKKTRIWETVIQSPYSVDIAADSVCVRAKSTLFDNKKAADLGITGIYLGKKDEAIGGRDNAAHNIVFDFKLRANYRSGYWELILAHTKPLGLVPEDMR